MRFSALRRFAVNAMTAEISLLVARLSINRTYHVPEQVYEITQRCAPVLSGYVRKVVP